MTNFEFRGKEIRKKRIDKSCIESIEIEDARLCLQYTEAPTGGVLSEKAFLEISQNSQEHTCVRVSF